MSCSRSGDESLRLRATVIAATKDTVRFALPARARYCHDGRSLLLEAASPLGHGVLIRLRYDDSLTSGVYPVVATGDTAPPRGAMVAVRFATRDVARTLTLDSGTVAVRHEARRLDARVQGWGLDRTVRAPVTVDYTDVPLAADTVPCRYEP